MLVKDLIVLLQQLDGNKGINFSAIMESGHSVSHGTTNDVEVEPHIECVVCGDYQDVEECDECTYPDEFENYNLIISVQCDNWQ